MRILIAGSGMLGASIMEALLYSEHEVVGLLLNGRGVTPFQRSMARTRASFISPALDIASLALRNQVPLLWLDDLQERELEALEKLEPDLIVVAGFSIIFKEDLLNIPSIGCVNVHSSLLPKHRGPSPFAHVILANEEESGVTFHAMDANIDTGDILYQATFPLTPIDTGMTVYRQCCDVAQQSVLDVMDQIELHGLVGTPQDPWLASYDPKMTHETAQIDWTLPAVDIERLTRAAIAYDAAWFMRHGRMIRVHRATYDPRIVKALPGTVLETTPYPVVATGSGRLIIHEAHISHPIPWTWPAPWSRLRCAELL